MRNIDETVFLADGARLSGQDITIGKDSAVWYNAVLRASRSPITIGERTNIQDGCILHADHFPIVMGDDVTTGHGAIVHGCTIHSRVLIGMGSILMDDVEVGEECIIAAGALVTGGTKIPPRSLVIGSPAKVRRQLTQEEIDNLTVISAEYAEFAREEKALAD